MYQRIVFNTNYSMSHSQESLTLNSIETKCKTFLMKNRFIGMRIKKTLTFFISGYALSLSLRQRLGVTLSWVLITIIEYDSCGKGIICWLITLVVRVFSNYRVQLKIIAKLWLTNHVIWRGQWDSWISPEISFRNSWPASSQVTLPVTSSQQPRILLANVGSSSC